MTRLPVFGPISAHKMHCGEDEKRAQKNSETNIELFVDASLFRAFEPLLMLDLSSV